MLQFGCSILLIVKTIQIYHYDPCSNLYWLLCFLMLAPTNCSFIMHANPCFSEVSGVVWDILLCKDFTWSQKTWNKELLLRTVCNYKYVQLSRYYSMYLLMGTFIIMTIPNWCRTHHLTITSIISNFHSKKTQVIK